jgi:hypothetical protein
MLTGAKPPLSPKHVWSVRTRLQLEGRTRDLAMFNLAIDSKLRDCDVVAIKVEDVAPHGYAADRATVRQRKTGRPCPPSPERASCRRRSCRPFHKNRAESAVAASATVEPTRQADRAALALSPWPRSPCAPVHPFPCGRPPPRPRHPCAAPPLLDWRSKCAGAAAPSACRSSIRARD